MNSTIRTPLIAGNWKMNLDHLQAIANVQKLAWSLNDGNHKFDEVEVAIFPPFTDLRSVQTLISADKLELTHGAQDLSPHAEGAYTGDISANFLSKLGCKYVLVGHSERREMHNETAAIVTAKAQAAIGAGLIPIICVGEAADEIVDGVENTAVTQLRETLPELQNGAEFVVAYEPVWAIGSGKAASPEHAESTSGLLRQLISETVDAKTATVTKILYGGSVTSSNVAGFMKQPNIDGVLVGGASLKPEEFSKIARYQKHIIT